MTDDRQLPIVENLRYLPWTHIWQATAWTAFGGTLLMDMLTKWSASGNIVALVSTVVVAAIGKWGIKRLTEWTPRQRNGDA